MRGAFGKPQGTVARVHLGQVIMSIRTKLQTKERVMEALRRAKFKFPGRQKSHISKKWGLTKFNADETGDMVDVKRLIPDGCGVKYIPNRGPLASGEPYTPEDFHAGRLRPPENTDVYLMIHDSSKIMK
ncbi:hypothetical protein U0070_021100 [Myodes glareolus]|uniref:Ribosomal protein L10e/L16 domain-containing protein n=1 Tax=Myodes glareolus TaxID=447135 RepID=A0AAW0HVL0_MYOGA